MRREHKPTNWVLEKDFIVMYNLIYYCECQNNCTFSQGKTESSGHVLANDLTS